jgi:hypothetical protein
LPRRLRLRSPPLQPLGRVLCRLRQRGAGPVNTRPLTSIHPARQFLRERLAEARKLRLRGITTSPIARPLGRLCHACQELLGRLDLGLCGPNLGLGRSPAPPKVGQGLAPACGRGRGKGGKADRPDAGQGTGPDARGGQKLRPEQGDRLADVDTLGGLAGLGSGDGGKAADLAALAVGCAGAGQKQGRGELVVQAQRTIQVMCGTDHGRFAHKAGDRGERTGNSQPGAGNGGNEPPHGRRIEPGARLTHGPHDRQGACGKGQPGRDGPGECLDCVGEGEAALGVGGEPEDALVVGCRGRWCWERA